MIFTSNDDFIEAISTIKERELDLVRTIAELKCDNLNLHSVMCDCLDRYGSWTDARRKWAHKLVARTHTDDESDRRIGDLFEILALFDRAAKHLKRPAVELTVPGFDNEWSIRINIAGHKAKVPGSLTVLSSQTFPEAGREFPARKWIGRIMRNGVFSAGDDVVENPSYLTAVMARLRAFAADPAKVGGDDGRLRGRCAFCRRPLSDERSTMMGYGAKCASHFSLAWGDRPTDFAEGAAK